VEDYQGHLWKPESCHGRCGDTNRPCQLSLAIRYSSEKGQTGEPANQQTGCVDEVGPEVQDFGSPNNRIVQNILDISKVSTRAKMDENDGENSEWDECSLRDLSVLALESVLTLH